MEPGSPEPGYMDRVGEIEEDLKLGWEPYPKSRVANWPHHDRVLNKHIPYLLRLARAADGLAEHIDLTGAEIIKHLEQMYPAALKACPETARVSLKNFVDNRVKSALTAYEEARNG